jgi:hypothetical protein
MVRTVLPMSHAFLCVILRIGIGPVELCLRRPSRDSMRKPFAQAEMNLWPSAGGEKLHVMTVTARPFSLARAITPLQQTGRRAGHAYRPRS